MRRLVVLAVPCFSGAPWDLAAFPRLGAQHELRTLALPEAVSDIDGYVDAVLEALPSNRPTVLVGDSFGALVSIGVAARRPPSLRALVLSGGFAADPNTSTVGRIRAFFGRSLPRFLYRAVTLRAHAAALSSPHDASAEVPWDRGKSRALFLTHTPWESYVARLRAIRGLDLRPLLPKIRVPSLILSPSYDKLVGREATDALLGGIAGANEVVLDGTGHMLRFTHPRRYEAAVLRFLDGVEAESTRLPGAAMPIADSRAPPSPFQLVRQKFRGHLASEGARPPTAEHSPPAGRRPAPSRAHPDRLRQGSNPASGLGLASKGGPTHSRNAGGLDVCARELAPGIGLTCRASSASSAERHATPV